MGVLYHKFRNVSLVSEGFVRYPIRWNAIVRVQLHDRILRFLLLRFLPTWVKPNHLTLLRIFLVIPVLILLFLREYGWGLSVFLLAAMTDAMDGSLARTRREISEWGIIWDPIADKMLVGLTTLILVIDLINPYLGLALVGVEFFMLAVGWFKVRKGSICQPNVWGKAKMLFEVLGLAALLLAAALNISLLISISSSLLIFAIILAMISVLTRL